MNLRGLGGRDDQQWLERRLRDDSGHSYVGKVTAGHIGEDAVGSVFGASAADVQALYGLDSQGGQQKAVGNTNPG